MLSHLFRQFGGPSGLLGRVAGALMSRRNGPSNRWIVDVLGIGPEDRVLDVGFGPGLAVAAAAERATSGFVAGLDHSSVMVRRATALSRAAIREGRVELACGDVTRIPYPDGTFTRALSVNSIQFWSAPRDGLAEICRVLEPGGVLVLGLRMRRAGAGRFDRSRYGFTPERAKEIAAILEAVGFSAAEARTNQVGGETLTALVARKGAES